MEDTCKVVVDYYSKKGKEREEVDTGLWKLIHKGNFIEEPAIAPGFNLICEGLKFAKEQDF
jgi:hypothetical protein